MAKKAKNVRIPLNTYLLKGDAEQATQYVDLSDLPYHANIVLEEGQEASLHYGIKSSAPDWLSILATLTSSPINELHGASVSGILLTKADGRLLAITFGHAWQKIRSHGVEPNFGIRCVLNLAEEDSLRAIRRDRVADESIQAIEQIPDSDDIYRFGIDIEKDLLRGVKAKINEELNFGAWVAGADSFKASVDLDSETIYSYLQRCIALYSKDDYKKKFKWIDNISPVRDEQIQHELCLALAAKLAETDTGMTLCVPDLLQWDDHDFFSFERKKKSQAACANYLNLEQWVGFATSGDKTITCETLHESRIYAYKQGGVISNSWPVIQCIHGLVLLGDKSYLAHAGHWFELNTDFVEQTNKRIAKIAESSVTLPATKLAEKEGDYNMRVASESGGALLLMDKKLIQHGGGKSRIEVCDLFMDTGHLICVKPWGGASGSLSHLFLQAKNSVQLINNDDEYREKVRAYISKQNEGFSLVWELICENPKDAEVVLAIMRGCSKEALPFFAKLSLVDCVDELQKMRFKASYLAIAVE